MIIFFQILRFYALSVEKDRVPPEIIPVSSFTKPVHAAKHLKTFRLDLVFLFAVFHKKCFRIVISVFENTKIVVKSLFSVISFYFSISLLSNYLTIPCLASLFIAKSSSPKKLIECSRIFFWQNIMEPSMTHPDKKINIFVNLHKKSLV